MKTQKPALRYRVIPCFLHVPIQDGHDAIAHLPPEIQQQCRDRGGFLSMDDDNGDRFAARPIFSTKEYQALKPTR